jgi:hypothetical protein
MQNASPIHKARDLAPELRRAAEALLGRVLQEDESISVRVFKGDIVKQALTREAFHRLRARIEQTAKPTQGVPEAEVDAAIDEAVDYVRHNCG